MKLYELIAALVQYGIDTGLTPACEKIYTTNLLLDQFHEDDYEEPDAIPSLSLEEILEGLLDEACRRELIPDSITYRDLFDTRLMNCLMQDLPRFRKPSARNMPFPRRKQRTIFTNCLRTATISAATGSAKTRNGKCPVSTATLTSPSTCQSRRKIRKPSQQLEKQRQVLIRNASSVWKMKAMPAASTIRPERTTGSFR